MQEAHVARAAPIAAIQGFRADEIERARDRLVAIEGEHQQQRIAHAFGKQIEGFARQIGRSPFARAGVLIEYPERVPVLGPDRVAAQPLDPHLGLRRRALLAQGAALARGEFAQESVEIVVPAIAPVILDIAPGHPARPFEQLDLPRLHEGRMGGRKTVLRA